MQRLNHLLSRTKTQTPADGIHVSAHGTLHLQGDQATLMLSSGSHHRVNMSSSGSGISVSITSTPSPGNELCFVREFPLVQAAQAQALFSSTVASWHNTLVAQPNAGAARRWPFVMAGLTVGLVLLMTLGLMTAPSSGRSSSAASTGASVPLAVLPQQQSTAPPVSPEAAAAEAQRRLQQARLGPQDLGRLSSAHRIQVRAGETPLLAFSDPNCSACQELEREAANLKQGQGFAVIPVAFQPGARSVAAKVLCASDPVRAWADALKGIVPREPACEAGLRKIDENNTLFSEIGASATPTLVAANGQLAQGSAPAAQLERFASTYAR
jgi:hypothetical protein